LQSKTWPFIFVVMIMEGVLSSIPTSIWSPSTFTGEQTWYESHSSKFGQFAPSRTIRTVGVLFPRTKSTILRSYLPWTRKSPTVSMWSTFSSD
jgi:hypothetical protein